MPVFLVVLFTATGCAFEPVKTSYSHKQVKMQSESEVAAHDSLLVFRTSGFRVWAMEDAEVLINGDKVAWFKAGGARYLPLLSGSNSLVVRQPDHILQCELEFDFEPGTGQFVEIYERFDPKAMLISLVFADLTSRLEYDPHPGSNCAGVYGLSMGHLNQKELVDVHREFSFQVVQR